MSSPNYKKGASFRYRGARFPTVESVLSFHDDILERHGGLVGIREMGLLESALHKVVEGFVGEDSYSTFFTKVAAVGFSIAQNHVFVDANKRTALHTMLVTLGLNGYKVKIDPLTASTVMILVATGNLEIAGLRVALIHWCGLNPGDSSL